MTFHNEMYCTMNFLSLLVATSKKHNFLSIRKIMFAVFPQLTNYKALLWIMTMREREREICLFASNLFNKLPLKTQKKNNNFTF